MLQFRRAAAYNRVEYDARPSERLCGSRTLDGGKNCIFFQNWPIQIL